MLAADTPATISVSSSRPLAPLEEVVNAASFSYPALYLKINTKTPSPLGFPLHILAEPLQFPPFDGSACFLSDRSASTVQEYSWLTQQDPSIAWVTQRLILSEHQLQGNLSVDASSSMSVRAPPVPSSTTPQPSAADSQSGLQIPPPGPSTASPAAAATISIPVINAHAVGLFSHLPCCRPSSITCPGFIWPLVLLCPTCQCRLRFHFCRSTAVSVEMDMRLPDYFRFNVSLLAFSPW